LCVGRFGLSCKKSGPHQNDLAHAFAAAEEDGASQEGSSDGMKP
jgi:hypothetical protein